MSDEVNVPAVPSAPVADVPMTLSTPAPLPPPPENPEASGGDAPAGAPDAAPTSFDALGAYFGVESGDRATASQAMLPALQTLAEKGKAASMPSPVYQQQMDSPPTAQVPVAQVPVAQVPVAQVPETPAPPTLPSIDFTSIDFGETAPEVVSAIKAMADQSNIALQSVRAEAQLAAQQAQQAQQAYTNLQDQQNQSQQQAVLDRATAHLDNLASGKYGVGANRTMMQTIATREVMDVAGNLIRGMTAYGGGAPTIESVMDAAVLLYEQRGQPAPSNPANPAPPALPPHTTGGALPAVVKHSGSAGAGNALMGNAEYIAGARAILAR